MEHTTDLLFVKPDSPYDEDLRIVIFALHKWIQGTDLIVRFQTMGRPAGSGEYERSFMLGFDKGLNGG